MLTLNQIKEYLIQFFENHYQINTCVYADDFDFSAKADVQYKVAHIQPVDPSTVNANEITYKFKIAIGDIEDPNNQDSENDIWSDCIQIANDFITYFGNDDFEDFFIDKNISITKFSEGNTDRVAGVVFALGIRQERLNNTCTLPLKNAFTGVTFTGNIVYPNNYYNLLQPYLTILSASSLYQPIGNYLTGATVDLTDYYTKEQSNSLFLTGYTVDFSDYYTKEQSNSLFLTGFTVDLSGYQLKGDYVSASTLSGYQLTGNYVSASTLNNYQLAGSYVSASTLNSYYTKTQSDAKYLTGYTLTATTLAGYGITDAYTKSQSDSKYLTGYTLNLTTTGSTGAATLSGNSLNIPQYSGFTNPMIALGDLIYGSTGGTAVRLSGNTGTTKMFLTQTGTGSGSAAPVYFDLFGSQNNWSGTQSIQGLTLGVYNTSNIYSNSPAALTGGLNPASWYAYDGTTAIAMRTGFYGSSTSVIASGFSYASVIVGSAPFGTMNSSVTPWATNLVVKKLGAVTTGTSSSIVNTASLFVEAPSPIATNNYGIYSQGNIAMFSSGTSGVTVIQVISGTSYNFNLPTTPGTKGQVLASNGGGTSAMTWTTILTANTLSGYNITSGDTLFDGKYLNVSASTLFQPVLTLTTSGTSGAATLNGSFLNIPQYSGNTSITYNAGTGLSLSTGNTFSIDQTFTPTWTGKHTWNNSVSASTGVGVAQSYTPTLTPSANSDTLVAVDIVPTFGTGFTSTNNIAVRMTGKASLGKVFGTLITDATFNYSTILIGSLQDSSGIFSSPGIWMNSTYTNAPTASNYIFNLDSGSGGCVLNAPSTNNPISLRVNNVTKAQVTTGGLFWGTLLNKPLSLTAINTSVTGTSAQFGTGVIVVTATTAITITSPTVAALATQIGATQGTSYDFALDNNLGTNTATLGLNTGIILLSAITGSNNLSVTSGSTGHFRFYFRSTSTASLMRIG